MDTHKQAQNPRHCRICLVRHGETPWNAERRLQGHLDVPLNDVGVAQAEATARSLQGRRFAAIYASDLTRAQQTAAPAARTLGLDAEPTATLRERHYGIFQGLTYDEAAQRHPEAYARFRAREPAFAFPDGGESLTAFAERIGTALKALAHRHLGEQILVVTHGGVLDIAHRLASKQPLEAPRDFPILNAALNWLDYDSDGPDWHLVAWGVQGHLEGARDELPNA